VFDWRSRAEWWQLFRYYQAGVANLAFGYVLFGLLIFVGLHVFAAQLVGHVLGVAFNYLTYSRYAFAREQANKVRFFASYVINYFLGLGALWVGLQFIASPYIAGLLAAIAVSAINYLLLKRLVFRA
jgi:putative flippase GtrA